MLDFPLITNGGSDGNEDEDDPGRGYRQRPGNGPDLGGDLSESPKAAYAAGPFTEDILQERFALDDDAVDCFWTDKLVLKDFRV